MKNSLFLLGAAAVVALSSCTKNEVLDVAENRAIGFDNAFVGNPVRAAIDDVADLQAVGFKVFGSFSTDDTYKGVFNDVDVIYKGSEWQSKTTEYWQKDKSYIFQAYSGNANATPTANGVAFTEYTASGDEDLLSAAVVNKGSITDVTKAGTVDFTFRHVLSQVKFTFTNGFNGNVKLAISNVKINGLATTGNYTLSELNTGTWGTLSGTSEYAPTISTEAFGASKTAVTAPKIVLPQNVKDKTVTFDLVVSGSLEFDKQKITVKLPDCLMAEGNIYNFTTELNASNIKDPEDPDQKLEPIEFTAKVSEWLPKNSANNGGVGTVE